MAEGGRLLVLTAEGDYLTNRILDESLGAESLHLLPESGVVAVDDSGVITMLERGNRTRYHTDLFALGCPLHVWSSYDELGLLVRAAASD